MFTLRDLKYLVAYLSPLAAFAGIYYQGWWSPGSVYMGFVLIPILELALPGNQHNTDPQLEERRQRLAFFDILLYLNLPILYGLVIYFLHTVTSGTLTTVEYVALTLNVGLMVGSVGINVAHELGHRSHTFPQIISKLLLLPALYQHFYIEHNRGHHLHVSTPRDPSTSRLGESVYAFWWRSISQSYRHAWQLEAKRLRHQSLPTRILANEMVHFSLFNILYLGSILGIFGWVGLGFAVAIALLGMLLLETVNYIEHYGLVRRRLASGRYEPVLPCHSWNSNHELGRIFLYELTRHSDHHYKSTRKYQVLRHWDESPELPLGYPGSMLLSLIPPLWFRVMDPRVQRARQTLAAV